MGTSKKRRPHGARPVEPSDPRWLVYAQQTTDWHRTHSGATVAEIQAAWDRIAKRLRLRAPRFRGGPTDEQAAVPKSLSIPPEHFRDESREESARVKQRLRSAPVPWIVSDATGRVWEEQRPLPPPAPSPRGGRPRTSTLTDEVLRHALKTGRTTREIAEQFKVTPRTIQRHRKTLSQ